MTQPTSFIDRLKQRMAGAQGFMGPGFGTPKPKEEKTRRVVRTNRWDDRVWKEARKTEGVDTLVNDLMIGDTHREGGHREAFEPLRADRGPVPVVLQGQPGPGEQAERGA